MEQLRNLLNRGDDDQPRGFNDDPDGGGGFEIDLSADLQLALAFGLTLIVGFCCALTTLPNLRPQTEPTPVPTVPVADFAEPTAREGYVAAVELIRTSDPGAILASAAGTWQPVINRVQLDSGRTGWTFHFYLPATQEMATVIVDRELAARVAALEPWETPPAVVEDNRWQEDSPGAMVTAIQACQETLSTVEATDLKATARLSMTTENLVPMWTVSIGSNNDPLTICEVRIDAVTGGIR